MQAKPNRRFQINPGPLRVRGEIPKEEWDRCEAILRDGECRCLRDAVCEVEGQRLCIQHAKLAEARGPA